MKTRAAFLAFFAARFSSSVLAGFFFSCFFWFIPLLMAVLQSGSLAGAEYCTPKAGVSIFRHGCGRHDRLNSLPERPWECRTAAGQEWGDEFIHGSAGHQRQQFAVPAGLVQRREAPSMKSTIVIIGAALLLLGVRRSPADEVSVAAQSAAQRAALTTCATCHGPQGRSMVSTFPTLAGQHRSYLVAQLKAFKAQTRGDPDALGYMWGMAAPLDDQMIEALSAYYSAQAPGHGRTGDAAEIARGADIYANGVAAEGIPPCIACHGPGAAGADQFPRLAGQHAPYLLKQLRSFQNNLRNVAVMHGVAKELQAKEMSAAARSEEHTSELQSPDHLVCRLLLEKK